jgi:hypothetical protein
MKFPEPTVDIEQIKQKYHAIVQEEGIGQESAEHVSSEAKEGQNRRKVKVKKNKKKK